MDAYAREQHAHVVAEELIDRCDLCPALRRMVQAQITCSASNITLCQGDRVCTQASYSSHALT